ncbi:MAG: RnfABCDGE type electron transport complex subunit D [Oscillospiraceae bacterium]|nr:RnfABCDGE type electron transport complex subunit D [Oscillospiraceae bacterium]
MEQTRRKAMRQQREKEQTVICAGALLSLLVIVSVDYGPRVLLLGAVAALTAYYTELAFLRISGKKPGARIYRAVLDGEILLMLMPVTVPVSLLIISCIFAVIIGNFRIKGDTAPLIPAAPAGYCLAWLISKKSLLLFPAKKGTVPLFRIDRSILTEGASAVWNRKWSFSSSPLNWITGVRKLPIGSCSLLMLAVIAGVFLLRRIASREVVLSAVISMTAAYEILTLMQIPGTAAAAAMMTNQFLFAVIFIYSEKRFAPPRTAGVLFGLLITSCYISTVRLHGHGDAVMWLGIAAGPAATALRLIMRAEKNKRTRAAHHKAPQRKSNKT